MSVDKIKEAREHLEEWLVREEGGGEWRGYCPECEEPGASNSPSAMFNFEENKWNCLKTEEDGGTISKLLTKRTGRVWHSWGKVNGQRPSKPLSCSDEDVERWHQNLIADESLCDWIENKKGWSIESLKAWKIGHDGQRYTIPNYEGDRLVGVKLYLPGAPQKIFSIPGSRNELFGRAALKEQEVLLCAGEPDCILASQEGWNAITWTGGEGNFKAAWAPLFMGKIVNICLDADDTGRTNTHKIAGMLKAYARVYIITIPEKSKGYDVTDLLLSGDPEELDRLVDEAEPLEIAEEDDDTSEFDEAVEEAVLKIKIQEAARRKVRSEGQRNYGDLTPIGLTEFLAMPNDPVQYRITWLWPTAGRIVLAAQFKAGKTTLTGNVLRSLCDGVRFLGRFESVPARVTVLDFEMDPNQIRQWLSDQGIQNTGNASVQPLRGKASSFDILDPHTRSEWADRLRGSEVVLFDCLRPVLDALGLSEDKDAGRFLVAFDELLSEAGVSEAMIIHHMGHQNERSRGDSRLLDWPDATWKLVRENPEDEDSPRYFSAFGRDVTQRESLLEYDTVTRHLTITHGNRLQAKDRKIDELKEHVLGIVRKNPGICVSDVERQLRKKKVSFQKGDASKALNALEDLDQVVMERGKRGSHQYSAVDTPAPPPTLDLPHGVPDGRTPAPPKGEGYTSDRINGQDVPQKESGPRIKV